jgi:hypothetical protein
MRACVCYVRFKGGDARICHYRLAGGLPFGICEMERWITEQSEKPIEAVVCNESVSALLQSPEFREALHRAHGQEDVPGRARGKR